MGRRILVISSVLLVLIFEVGCGSTAQLNSISVTPSTATIQNVGGTAQFTATGIFFNGKNGNQYSQNLTTQVVWSSSTTSVATINSSGLATATGVGTTTITATGGNGGLTATAMLTVVNQGTGGNTLQSIDVIPANQTVNLVNETAQYIAIGNYSGTPGTQDLTDQVTWSSSDVRIATIDPAGLATGVGDCGSMQQVTTITALAPPSTGTAITGTATFTIGTCGTNNLPTLAVYEVGQGTGVVTSSPSGVDCPGSGQAGCTANFPLNSMVDLSAAPNTGSVFGGFSANCTAVLPDPNPCTKQSNVQSCTCSVTMGNNTAVGAIFNLQ